MCASATAPRSHEIPIKIPTKSGLERAGGRFSGGVGRRERIWGGGGLVVAIPARNS